uniref:Putative secreted peptide n=1 Tax=Anopheles braziliensis TaxID=58242 RepID=A0A2M3ZVE4_9DIPT
MRSVSTLPSFCFSCCCGCCGGLGGSGTTLIRRFRSFANELAAETSAFPESPSPPFSFSVGSRITRDLRCEVRFGANGAGVED